MIKILIVREHFECYLNNAFLFSGDTYEEIMQEILLMKPEIGELTFL